MSVKTIPNGQPFFTIRYIENEKDFHIEPLSILINMAIESKADIMINGIPQVPLHGVVVGNITIPEIEKAILIEDFEKYTKEPDFFDRIRETWPHMYSLRQEERFRNAPMYVATGDAHITPNIDLGVCCVIGENFSTGLHKTHPRDIDEYHVQIAGVGKMQKFYENDINTMFQDIYMAPGIVHDTIFDADGNYTWHQYKTVTPSVFMGIKIDR
ncbi:MAG: hypothetical protein HDT18_05350 [Oscillibacter sp.]|nr:hypothetical protein [Oscillibacter sp.]